MDSLSDSTAPSPAHLKQSDLRFPVVGVGASAGGIAVLRTFFGQMPARPGMAFVVVMHLSPRHESSIDKILQAVTNMPVKQVTEPVPIEVDHVYVIPPALDLSMNDGYLRLQKPKRERGAQVAIDLFFRALADVHHTHAIGIVLSGAGGDGAVGLSRIKEQGGVTLAQLPTEAEYDSMPRSAIETGAVDIVLPVAEMPQRLLEVAANMAALLADYSEIMPPDGADVQPLAKTNELALRDILTLLRSRTGHDFKHYKQATVLRRIERRMQVNAIRDMPSYARFLHEHADETPALLGDMLIGVTNFFRDREAFEALEREVIPLLFERPDTDDDEAGIRVWSAACATGEEAYSLAMLLSDQLVISDQTRPLHVFATDIDDRALAVGRSGLYPEAIITDVPPARLRQFFGKEGNHYRIKKELRERILFARHNVLRDPPFSRLDLIACRNLLIYLDRDVQQEVLRMFHFALKPGGYLFLGSSETADACSQLFAPVDKKNRIYRAKELAGSQRRPPLSANGFLTPQASHAPAQTRAMGRKFSFADVHQRVLEQYAPPSVIVDSEYNIVHMSDRAGRFLRYIAGEPSLNLPALVLPELRLELRTALYQGAHTRKSVEARRVRLPRDGRTYYINMVVRPFRDDEAKSEYMLVLFDEVEDVMDSSAPGGDGEVRDSVLTQLEAELQRTKEQLQLTMEHSETSTEELRASNEELQAINEELITVNAELKAKVDETSKVNDDLQNLITSTDMATVFVDRNMRIKWFTPRARDIFNLIGKDAGRSLLDITHRLDYPDLAKDAARTFDQLQTVEREVPSSEGRWFLSRLLPYRTADDRIQGAVLTFIDITDRHRAEERVRAGEAHLRVLARSTPGYAIIGTDRDGRVTAWNRGAELLFGWSEAEAVEQPVELIYAPADCDAGLPAADRNGALAGGFVTCERWQQRKGGERVFCSVLVNPIVDRELVGFAVIARDLTQQQRERARHDDQLRDMVDSSSRKDQFFAVLAHELKHPLNLIHLNAELILRSPVARSSPPLFKAAEAIQHAVRSQSRIIDDLTDVSRVHTGKLKLDISTVELGDFLDAVAPVFATQARDARIAFEVEKPAAPLYVAVDVTRLEQIVWNLLNNALKFTAGGGRITLRAQGDGQWGWIDVEDTGQGISRDDLPKVFELFGQAEVQHVPRSKDGLGIGLALVKQLVEAHGGLVDVSSQGLGRGAVFTVKLPVCAQTELALQQANQFGLALEGKRILLVDDSTGTLEMLQLLLESEGASVMAVSGGPEGAAAAAEHEFDVIISDIGMPEMTGFEMVAAIRQGTRNQEVPCISLSGYGSASDVEASRRNGFAIHLTKPVDLETLVKSVLTCARH